MGGSGGECEGLGSTSVCARVCVCVLLALRSLRPAADSRA